MALITFTGNCNPPGWRSYGSILVSEKFSIKEIQGLWILRLSIRYSEWRCVYGSLEVCDRASGVSVSCDFADQSG